MPRFVLLLLSLLLIACATDPIEPPPYPVYFADNVPQADRDTWGGAAGDWNKAVGTTVFLVGAEPAHGRCGIEIVMVDAWYDATTPAWTEPPECITQIWYARGEATATTALHELGHRLTGAGHVAGTVMDEWPDDYAPEVTPALAERVRERWGLPAPGQDFVKDP